MKEEIKLFLQKVAADEELQKKLQACTSPEEAYAVASSVQDGFTFEEFVETMTKVNDYLNQRNTELSDDELAKAAGGGYYPDTYDNIAGTLIFSMGMVWAAAAAS